MSKKDQIIKSYSEDEIDVFAAISKLDTLSIGKKEQGVVYTPNAIASQMIQDIQLTPEKTVLEPSFGHGLFIFSTLEYFKDNYSLSNNDLKNWFENKMFGIEIDAEKVEDFKKMMSIYFKKLGINKISFNNIKKADALFCVLNKEVFDFCIGNPPYVRSKNLNKDYLNKIKGAYKSCNSGNIDLYYAFVERFVKKSKKCSFIIPNSIVRNKSAQTLRSIIKDDLHSLIDFQEKQVFPGVSTYTAILTTDTKNKNEHFYYKNDFNQDWNTYEKSELSKDQWAFFDMGDTQGFYQLKEKYNVKTGVATLRDSLYIVDVSGQSNNDFISVFYKGEEYFIEKEATLKFYKGTKMEKDYRIIFPYNIEDKKIIEENILRINFPYLYKYLSAIKNELLLRDKGKTENYSTWYAYGRKQGLDFERRRWAVIFSVMTRGKIKTHLIKNPEPFLFVSAYVVYCDNLKEVKHLLKQTKTSRFFEYIKSNGKQWAGNPPYYTYSAKHFKNFLLSPEK